MYSKVKCLELIDSMPSDKLITRKQLVNEGRKAVKYDMKYYTRVGTSVDGALKELIENGKLKRVGNGLYKKIV